MPVVVVANPKGGVGKSTVATQIAGYFAWRGRAVMLGDVDRQQSSRERRCDVGYGSPLLHARIVPSEASTRIYTRINDLARKDGFVTGSERVRGWFKAASASPPVRNSL